MFRSLRNRLIFSHILPFLVVIPLMGFAMLYVLENQVLLPFVYENLAADARLMAEITSSPLELWTNPVFAQALLQGADEFLNGEVDLLFLDGTVLASGRSGGASLIGQRVDLPDLSGLRKVDILEFQRGPSAEVYTPVVSGSGQILGIVRMTTRVITVTEEVYQLRYLLGVMLFVGAVAGVLLGSFLAVNINRPIQQITQSIASLGKGNWDHHLDEIGYTETRMLARTVNELVDQLHRMELTRRKLLANLVHEIGRPLGAFRSANQALLKGAIQDSKLSYELLQGMESETERLHRLLDDLAQLHDQVLGTLELHRIHLNLQDWLPGLLTPWEAAANQKDLSWEVSIPPDLPPVFADPDRLAQVISNLLSNAIKFTPQKGRIAISVQPDQDRVWVHVQDTGSGIPIEEQEHIFEPFYRSKQGKRIVQGMGLGLSIAQEIIHAHGGEIQFESKPGSGSRFSFWLNR